MGTESLTFFFAAEEDNFRFIFVNLKEILLTQ